MDPSDISSSILRSSILRIVAQDSGGPYETEKIKAPLYASSVVYNKCKTNEEKIIYNSYYEPYVNQYDMCKIYGIKFYDEDNINKINGIKIKIQIHVDYNKEIFIDKVIMYSFCNIKKII